MYKVLKEAYTYSCRGLVNINDLTLSDSVFTIKGRWQEIDSFTHLPIEKWAKANESLSVPLASSQVVYTNKILGNPKIVPPRDVNSDQKDTDFWFLVGFLCKHIEELHNFQKDSELYTFVRRLGSIYSPSFNLPMNILTLPRSKLEALLNGLNITIEDTELFNKKTKLLLITILQRIKVSFSSKYNIMLDSYEVKEATTKDKYIRLLTLKDGGYYLNGLFVVNE
jgi:hypothetical protein